MADTPPPVINDEADRALGRIILRYGLITVPLLLIAPFGMAFVNVPSSPLYGDRRFLDTLSILVILLPFFRGINRLFAARLALGRAFVPQRRWQEAIAALDPFAGPTQRFLDKTGEAHYLLSLAYQGVGDLPRAEAARAFVRRHRPGVWTDALDRPTRFVQEKRPRPVKSRARRRF